MDPYKFTRIALNSDGSLTRLWQHPTRPANPDEKVQFDSGVESITLSMDILLNANTKTFIRLFRPRRLLPATNLPIIIDAHGGGFIRFSATSKPFHELCAAISAATPAFVATVEYRLAPEHRLPAAYEDVLDAVKWVRDQALGTNGTNEWLRNSADFSTCLLMGTSSGGNIAYNACQLALELDISPVKIQGLILSQPFFGGSKRTESELRLVNDRVVPLAACDLVWTLALPEGTDRDHPYCCPMISGSRNEMIGRLPKCFVRIHGGDPFVDRQKEFVKMLESRGVHVLTVFRKDGGHSVELFDPVEAKYLVDDVRGFVHSLNNPKSAL